MQNFLGNGYRFGDGPLGNPPERFCRSSSLGNIPFERDPPAGDGILVEEATHGDEQTGDAHTSTETLTNGNFWIFLFEILKFFWNFNLKIIFWILDLSPAATETNMEIREISPNRIETEENSRKIQTFIPNQIGKNVPVFKYSHGTILRGIRGGKAFGIGSGNSRSVSEMEMGQMNPGTSRTTSNQMETRFETFGPEVYDRAIGGEFGVHGSGIGALQGVDTGVYRQTIEIGNEARPEMSVGEIFRALRARCDIL